MVGSPWAGGGMVINWYQLIQSQESIQIIILCINFIELLKWFKGTSLTSPESLNYDTLVGASFHDTRQTASLHCEAFVQALLRHFLPKNGFIVGIQENSSSSNSPSIQFTQDEWLFEIKFLRFWFDFAFSTTTVALTTLKTVLKEKS